MSTESALSMVSVNYPYTFEENVGNIVIASLLLSLYCSISFFTSGGIPFKFALYITPNNLRHNVDVDI